MSTEDDKMARALAMEEAAQRIDDAGFVNVYPGSDDEYEEEPAGNILRRLAPLHPSLKAVPRETWEQAKAALEMVKKSPLWVYKAQVSAAIAAMNKVKT